MEHKDFFNKTKGERILDELRDQLLLKQNGDLKTMFMKTTETDNDEFDKTVMTQDHFIRMTKQLIGDKFSTREIEAVYRGVVHQKPLTFKRFVKVF